jgi:hypothetical protein
VCLAQPCAEALARCRSAQPFREGKEHDDMTVRISSQPTSAGRYRSGNARWPHVGECTFAGLRDLRMVKQRDGGRVSAAGDAR